jgi:hypothetical protein
VRASAPIFSFVHCFKRSNFLVTFIVAVVCGCRGQSARGDAAQCDNERWAESREYIDNARHTNGQEQRDEEQQPDQPPVNIEKRAGVGMQKV